MLPKLIAAVPVLLLLFGSEHAECADISSIGAAVPVQILDGGFVRHWLVLGPFDSEDFG